MEKQDTEEKARSLTTFRNYMEAADYFKDPVERCAFYDALMHYGFDGIEPQNLNEIGRLLFQMIKPSLNKSINNRRPGNTNATGTRIERDSNTNETRIERAHLLENKNKNKNIENISASDDAESVFPFSEFWEMYGKKTGRSQCEKVYAKISETDRRTIKEKLPAYIASTSDLRYRKNPLTWLHGQNWDDEIFSPSAPAPAESMPIEDVIAKMKAEQERANRLRNGEVC